MNVVNASGVVVGHGRTVIDSNNADAAIATGNATVVAGEIDVTGQPGTLATGSATFQGQIQSGAKPLSDPLASLPVPSAPSSTITAANYSGKTTVTLGPGTYTGGIHLSGQAQVTLQPGLYYLQGGGLSVTGQASLSGTGVTIYNAPSSSSDTITVSGNGSVQLTPPGSGTYAGTTIFQDRSSAAPISITGNGALDLEGRIYAAGATINVTGNGDAIGAQLIALDMNVTGNGDVTLQQVVPSVAVADAGGVYTGSAYPATATVNGAASLEGVTPTLTYYAGPSASGTPLATAPTSAGTYTVLAAFAGSADYTSASAQTTFTVARATPTVSVSDAGGTFNGQPFPATAAVAGVSGGKAASLEGVTPALTYYSGTYTSSSQLTGLQGSSQAPYAAGNYTVLAAFPGSTDYTTASALANFTIQPQVVGPLATPVLDPGSDSSKGKDITNVTTPIVHDAAPSGLNVSFLVNGQLLQQAVSVNGTATATLGPLTDGRYSIVAAVETSPGVFSSNSAPLTITILTRPPTTPVFDLAAGTADLGPGTTSAARVTLVGHTDAGDTVTLAGPGLAALASNSGAFQIPNVNLAPGTNVLTVQARDIAGNTSSYSLTVTRGTSTSAANPVIVWNQATLNAIQTDGTDPLMASRALAMVQAAVYDAVNNVQGTGAHYVKVAAPADASVQAAVDAAAHAVLLYLYPDQEPAFDALLSAQLALLPAGQGTTDGETVGQAVGNAIVALRQNDGATSYVDFESGTAPGDWQPTAPAFALALDPQGGNMTPWAMTSDSQFDPAGPPALTSAQWAAAVNQAESLGAFNSTTRTAAQTTLAKFWNDGVSTNTPTGHWNAIAQTVAQQQGESLADDARLFAELDVSMADAGIATWNTKYLYDTWRPITVIPEGGDGVNPAVTADPGWTPLLTTPNFPEYVSGHSAYSMAAATVLDSFFGSNVTFTTTEPTTTLSLTYTSFDQAAQDAGMSRLYGGIHFLFSIQDGWTVGQEVAQFDLATFSVSKDTTPPRVELNKVLPSGASNTNVTITGAVMDNLSGVASLAVQVDGGSYQPLAFNAATGSLSFTTAYALNGSADGTHTIDFRATNYAGITAAPVPFTFILATQAPTLTLTSPTSRGTLAAGATLTGTFSTDVGVPVVCLCYAFDGSSTMIPVPFITPSTLLPGETFGSSNADGSFSQALDLSKLAAGTHTLKVTAQDAAGNTTTQTLTLTLAGAAPLTVTSLTPAQASTDVGVTYRPEVSFSRAINTSTLNSSNFYATDTTGAVIPATIVPSQDGTYAWLFFTNPMPGASIITLTLKGSTIKAADGTLLDAAGDGTPGSVLTQTFTTVSTTPVAGTTLTGVVADPGPDDEPGTRDDYQTDPGGVYGSTPTDFLRPIQGVEVYILGMENAPVYTDAAGRFTFTNVPTGDVKLAVEGNVPGVTVYDPAQGKFIAPGSEGFYFPQMTLDLTIQPGVVNTVMGTMGTEQEQAANTGNLGVYLPRVQTSILQTASNTAPTTVGVSGESGLGLTPLQQSELKLTVMPNSAIGTNGQPMSSFQVGISTVPPSIVMDMLPAGVMQHTFDITIQAPGVATFTTPAQLTFPNVFDAAPGTQLDVLSFDHTTGRLVIDGTATVSADGLTVVTDPGTGVTQAGWHGLTPPRTQAKNDKKKITKDPEPILPIIAQCMNNPPVTIGGLSATVESDGGEGGVFVLNPPYRSLMSDANGTKFRFFQVVTHDDHLPSWPGGTLDPTEYIVDPPAGGWGYEQNMGGEDYSPYYDQDSVIDPFTDRPYAYPSLAYPNSHSEDGGWMVTVDQPTFRSGPNQEITFATFLAYEDENDAGMKIVNILGGYTWGLQTDSLGGHSVIPPTFIPFSDIDGDLLNHLQGALDQSGYAAWRVIASDHIIPCPPSTPSSGSGATPPAAPPSDPPPVPGSAPTTTAPTNPPSESTAAVFGSDPKYYYSFQLRNGVTIGGKIEPDQQISAFLPPDTPYVLYLYQPSTNLSGVRSGISNSSGAVTDLGTLNVGSFGGLDTNGDGIPDVGKLAMGLPLTGPDRTTDGLGYAANLEAGLDPLGNGGSITGVAAGLSLRGSAQGVNLEGSALDPTGQTAYVATGSYGLAIVNASDFEHPVLQGQIQLPGNSTDVAVDPSLKVTAVASTTGLNLVDVSNPQQPRLLQTLGVNTSLVRVKDGVAYAAVGGQVQAYDLLTGDLLQSLTVSANSITALALDGSFLYTLDAGNTLKVVDLSNPLMVARGSVTLAAGATMAGGSGALVVGNGVAYMGVTRFLKPPLGAVSGYITADVSNPDSPKAISGEPSSAAAGTALAANGSGTALTVGSDLTGPGVDVFNSADPTNVAQFITRFALPQSALGVAIGEGIAFIADGSGGLQVVNYLPLDTTGVPPTASITLPASAVVGTGSDGHPEVVEGSRLTIQPTVGSNVQVRNVELLVNGNVVQNAVSFPFDLSTTLPTIAKVGSAPVTIQVEAFDTGGNIGLSNVLTVDLVKDTVPPVLLSSSVTNGSTVPQPFQAITLQFSKPLDPATVTAATFSLTGPTGTVAPANIQFRRNNAGVDLTYPALGVGSYQLVIEAAAVKDVAGNPLGTANQVIAFTVASFSDEWINPAGGFWDVASNWRTGAVPGPSDNVYIGLPSNNLVTFRTGNVTVSSLTIASPFAITGGTLSVTSPSTWNAPVTMSGGTLGGSGNVTMAASFAWTGGALAGTGKTVVAPTASLSLSGSSNLQLDAELDNEGTATWTSGALLMDNGTLVNSGAFTAATSSTLLSEGFPGGTNAFSNTGTFTDQGPGAVEFTTFTTAVAFNNAGTVNVTGGTLNLNAGGSQTGAFNVAAGTTLALGGAQTFSGAAPISGNGNLLVASGTDSYPLGLSTTGSLTFQGGSFTVAGPVSATTLTVSGGTATLNGATAVSNLALGSGTLNGSGPVTVHTAMTWTGGALAGPGKTVVTPAASLSLGGNLQLDAELDNQGTATWTSGSLNMDNGTLVNSGTFTAATSGTLFSEGLGGTNAFNNTGTFTDQGPGAVEFTTFTTGVAFNNSGTVNVDAGTLLLTAPGANTGSITVGAGATLSISGNFTEAGSGSLTVEIGGTGANQVGQIIVSGAVALNGTLNIVLVNGFVPASGQSFKVMTWSSESGGFSTINDPAGTTFTVIFDPFDLNLTVK